MSKSVVTSSFKIESKVKQVVAGLRKETLKNAAWAGGEVIRGNAQANIARVFKTSGGDSGLSGSIDVRVSESSIDGCVVDVGPTKLHGRIKEMGGIIKPVFAKMLSWINESGERVFAKSVTVPPNPYLRPAMDEHHDEINAAVGEQIRLGIERAL
jgi:hypothetical protein